MTDASPQVYAILSSYQEFVRAVTRRMDERELSHAALEQIAGLASGMVGKACGPSMTKKFGPLTMFNVAWGLGLGIAFVEDPEAAAATADLALPRQSRQARPGNRAQQRPSKHVISRVQRYFAKRSAKARMARAKLAAEQAAKTNGSRGNGRHFDATG
jgi:hypothetical protein